MRTTRLRLAATTLAAVLAGNSAAQAACPSSAEAAAMAARFAHLEAMPQPPADLSVADALCGRDRFTAFLAQQAGPVAGYKAGLTNPAVQKRFGHPAPLRGTLFRSMLLADGAEVPARFGARPLFEADLVVEVKDAGIHGAKTPLDVLRHLSAVHPFIELPDLMVQDPTKLTGAGVALVNVGARLGILGKALPVKADAAFADALAGMTVVLRDGDGKEIDRGKGSDVLGHPLNAAIWLAQDLKQAGITLKKGDLLSLGSFSRLLPPRPGLAVTATYEGLPGNPIVGVRFR
jgi:2-keto-4-pentenoate hydratase